MLQLRKSEERGRFQNEWLDSYHTFSFGSYYDPEFIQFGTLRVINQDVIAPSSGFGMHGHKDMEIFTYVLSGVLEHKDSMGNKEQIRAGEVQIMSAGTGVVHSEYNPSATESVELLQIWVLPGQLRIEPRYAQKFFERDEKLNQLRLIISPDETNESLKIVQKTWVWASLLENGKKLNFQPQEGKRAWFHVGSGSVKVGDHTLNKGDSMAIENEKEIQIIGQSEISDLILIEV
jgi:redox-sensitive bicupin YhaK (pirin superfamily)